MVCCRWYSELHPKWNDPDWKPGASLITTAKRVTPKLLKLTWDGYPLYYDSKHGWGYIVPCKSDIDGRRCGRVVKDWVLKPRVPDTLYVKFCKNLSGYLILFRA